MHTVGGMDHRQCRTGDRSRAVDTGGVCRTAHDTRHPPCRFPEVQVSPYGMQLAAE